MFGAGEENRNSRLRVQEAAKDQNGTCVEEFVADGNSSGLEPRQQEEVKKYYQHDNQQ